MSDIHFVLLCNYGAVFFLIFCMLLAHIVDYKVCKMYFVALTNKETYTFDSTPFREIDKKQIYPHYS